MAQPANDVPMSMAPAAGPAPAVGPVPHALTVHDQMWRVKPCIQGTCDWNDGQWCNIQQPKHGMTPPELALVKEILTVPHVCIAGGFVVLSCMDSVTDKEDSDIDVWIFGSDPDHDVKRVAFDSIVKILFSRPNTVAGIVGSSVVTFSIAGFPRNVQVIMSAAISPELICKSFDIDACRAFLMLDRERGKILCFASKRTKKSWHSMTISRVIKDPNTDNRLAKMWFRGFHIRPAFHILPRAELTRYMSASCFFHDVAASPAEIEQAMKAKLPHVHTVCFNGPQLANMFAYQSLIKLDYDNLSGQN